MNRPLIIDSFAGGGGASTGIEMALGRSPDIAINHDPVALALHAANHPDTLHVSKNVYRIDPLDYLRGQDIGLAWFSPDCKHFSKAKGGKPVERNIRDLAWIIPGWIERIQKSGGKVDVVIMENVEEWKDWGPLIPTERGLMPRPDRRGETFEKWKKAIKRLGGKIQHRGLRACDYGAPTIRKRLFVILRFDRQKIVWPAPTHGAPNDPDVIAGRKKPWRTAADIIDWSIPCPSIFDTAEQIKAKHGVRAIRPLATNTLKRIAAGVQRYVIDAAKPFIVTCNHAGEGFRGQSLDEPLSTITVRDAHGIIVPIVTAAQHGGSLRSADQPIHTITASPKDQNAIIVPHLVSYYGPKPGRDDRTSMANEPLPTVTCANRHAVVAAFLAQHNTQREGINPGRAADIPLSTITARGGQQQVVAAHLMNMKGTGRHAQAIDEPVPTICASTTHAALVSAFMVKYYGVGVGQSMDEPVHTVTTRDRFGLVTVTIDGEDYVIVDIGMRMLTEREKFLAQGFPPDYIIDCEFNGRKLTKSEQGGCVGNSVSPPPAAALIAANCSHLAEFREAAQ